MTDRETGRSRGFAFVEMENEGEADQVISALNGYTLEGPRTERERSPPQAGAQLRRRWRLWRRPRSRRWRRRWTPRAALVAVRCAGGGGAPHAGDYHPGAP